LRLERLRLRDRISPEQLAGLEQHSTEIEVERHFRRIADLALTNCGALEVCEQQILRWAAERRLL